MELTVGGAIAEEQQKEDESREGAAADSMSSSLI